MEIKIYGAGCANCQKLYQLAEQAVKELNLDIHVTKVENINDITSAGVLRTPGLGFDDKIIVQGKIPTLVIIKSRLTEYITNND